MITEGPPLNRQNIIGKALSDIAFSEDEGSVFFQIDEIWIQFPWAGHPVNERKVATDVISLVQAASSQSRLFKREILEWLRHQHTCFSAIKGKIADVWCENVDPILGFNDPGENWLVFEDEKCLSVHYPMPVFGPSLPTLVLEDAVTLKERSVIMSFFDLPASSALLP
jgi:hypothetical protein